MFVSLAELYGCFICACIIRCTHITTASIYAPHKSHASQLSRYARTKPPGRSVRRIVGLRRPFHCEAPPRTLSPLLAAYIGMCRQCRDWAQFSRTKLACACFSGWGDRIATGIRNWRKMCIVQLDYSFDVQALDYSYKMHVCYMMSEVGRREVYIKSNNIHANIH